MTVENINTSNANYAQLLGQVNSLIAPKKINIKVFDQNMDGKLSVKELKKALTLIPNMKVSQGIVSLNEVDKNGNIIETTKKIITGTFLDNTKFQYDKNGKKIKATTTSGKGKISTTTYTYYDNGALKTSSTKDSKGKTITLNYSENGMFIGAE